MKTYTIRIFENVVDDRETVYEGTVEEFPDVRDYGESEEEVLLLLVDTILTLKSMN